MTGIFKQMDLARYAEGGETVNNSTRVCQRVLGCCRWPIQCWWQLILIVAISYMMTSPNGNISALLALCAGIHRSPMNSPHIGQWRGALMFFFYLGLNKRLSKNPGDGDFRRYRSHYDVTVMYTYIYMSDSSHDIQWILVCKCAMIIKMKYKVGVFLAFMVSSSLASIVLIWCDMHITITLLNPCPCRRSFDNASFQT